MTRYFIQPEWPAPPQVKAFCSLRACGNMAEETQRLQLKERLNLPSEPIWIQQVHGNTVIEARALHRGQEADASFTTEIGQVCAVLTADCLPILLCGPKGPQVAAIHAGWRGLANGIIGQTLKKLSLPPQQFLAWLGPAIGPLKYEVGAEVYEIFCAQSLDNQKAFQKTSATTWLANLYKLARLQLRALGVSQIFGAEYCTYTENDNFFSYRREQGKTGRMASLIWIDAYK